MSSIKVISAAVLFTCLLILSSVRPDSFPLQEEDVKVILRNIQLKKMRDSLDIFVNFMTLQRQKNQENENLPIVLKKSSTGTDLSESNVNEIVFKALADDSHAIYALVDDLLTRYENYDQQYIDRSCSFLGVATSECQKNIAVQEVENIIRKNLVESMRSILRRTQLTIKEDIKQLNDKIEENETVHEKLLKGEQVRVRIRNRHNLEYLYAEEDSSVYTTASKNYISPDVSIWILEPIPLYQPEHTPNVFRPNDETLVTIRIMNAGTKEHLYAKATANFLRSSRNVYTSKGDPSGSNWGRDGDWNLERNSLYDGHNQYKLFNDYYKEHLYTSGSSVYTWRRTLSDDDDSWEHTHEWVFEIIDESLLE